MWTGKQAAIVNITEAAGNEPTAAQLADAIEQVSEMYGGDATAALGAIKQIRELGTDNPLLAELDHYFNAKSSVQTSPAPGLTWVKVLVCNLVYSSAKGLGIPVGQDTSKPTSPVTWQQWMAGNYGASDGLMPD
jgi:hypothetical protein